MQDKKTKYYHQMKANIQEDRGINEKQDVENTQNTIQNDFAFTLKSTRLDENYHPSSETRLTTNFANLASRR